MMTDTSDPDRYPIEYTDEAGYPDGTGTLTQDQVALIDEVSDPHTPAMDFIVVNDEKTSVYTAISGDRELGFLDYHLTPHERIVLLTTSVTPDYQGLGIATGLIEHALDDIRDKGLTITVMCPIVHAYINRNPAYADLVDTERPGLTDRGA
jgi:predicted GNAT family acetyltransferase